MTGSAPELRRVVLFTRDLRLHDNPALDLACRQAAEVIPVFVLDPVARRPGCLRVGVRNEGCAGRCGFR